MPRRRTDPPPVDWPASGPTPRIKDFRPRPELSEPVLGSGRWVAWKALRRPFGVTEKELWNALRAECPNNIWNTFDKVDEGYQVLNHRNGWGILTDPMSGRTFAYSDDNERASRLSAMRKLDVVVTNSTEESAEQEFMEGRLITVAVNRYERNRKAKDTCIDHYGYDCAVCGFNFAKMYGPIGEGIIHVHHLRELASIGAEHPVDPKEDLRPVCPNCHAMLHLESPPMSIERLQQFIATAQSGGYA